MMQQRTRRQERHPQWMRFAVLACYLLATLGSAAHPLFHVAGHSHECADEAGWRAQEADQAHHAATANACAVCASIARSVAVAASSPMLLDILEGTAQAVEPTDNLPAEPRARQEQRGPPAQTRIV
jgi:hypothetical protein